MTVGRAKPMKHRVAERHLRKPHRTWFLDSGKEQEWEEEKKDEENEQDHYQ